MNETPRGKIADDATGATLLGMLLLAVAALEALVIGWNTLIYGMFPLLASRGRNLQWLGGFLFQQWGAAMILLAKVFAAGGLLFREPWARPWVVWTSLATLSGLAWTLYAYGEPFSGAWKDFLRVPGILTLPRALLVVAGPLVAIVALVLIALRGREWLPATSRSQWIAAAVAIILLQAVLFGHSWYNDPRRTQARAAEEVAGLSVPPGTGRLVIVPTFDGAPLDATFEANVSLRLTDMKTKTKTPRSIRARYANGVIEISDVGTGVYGVTFGIDANLANGTGRGWGMPGDFISWGGDRWDLLQDGQTVRQEVQVYRIIRLLQPEDSGLGVGHRNDAPPRLRSPLTIAWEPVPGARSYSFSLYRKSTADSEGVAGEQGSETSYTIELTPTRPGERYVLDITAYGEHGQVGIFDVQGTNWRGWDYQFEIEP